MSMTLESMDDLEDRKWSPQMIYSLLVYSLGSPCLSAHLCLHLLAVCPDPAVTSTGLWHLDTGSWELASCFQLLGSLLVLFGGVGRV